VKKTDERTEHENENGSTADGEFKIEDRRHSQDEDVLSEAEETAAPARPTIIDEFRERTEAAERKLQDYIEAFKGHREEQDRFRARIERDVDRRVDLKFGELIGDLLQTLDDLDRSLDHVAGVSGAEPLAEGVAMARDRFLATLERHGVEKVSPEGRPFDPNEAEALRIDPVDSPDSDGAVTETLQAGYRMGDRVIRAARVAVGRFKSDD